MRRPSTPSARCIKPRRMQTHGRPKPLVPSANRKKRSGKLPLLRLSKKWLAPLFRGFHSSLAPTARPGSYAEKPLLRKAFCGFAVHAAKSDYSLRGLRPPNPRGFFDRLGARRQVCHRALCFAMRCPKRALRTRGAKRPRLKGDTAQKHRTKGENKMPRLSHVMERRSQGG